MTSPISFIICTEPGKLEQLSILLVRSIRKFAGSLADTPIFSYQPRSGPSISRFTARNFDRLGVVHRAVRLNSEYADYPVANKPLTAAYAERDVKSELLVFLDSDQVVFNEPSLLVLPDQYDVGLRPVAMKGVGAGDQEDPNYPYWARLYDLVGAREHTYVTSVVDNQRVLSYFNSGLVTVRKTAGIFSSWADNFRKAMRQGLMPEPGVFYVEQSSLAATIAADPARVLILPECYNYPLNLQDKIAPAQRITNMRDMTTAHYHGKRKLVRLVNENKDSNRQASEWFRSQLNDLGMCPRNLRGWLTHSRHRLRQHMIRRHRQLR